VLSVIETSIRLPTKRELIQESYPASDQSARLSNTAAKLAKEGKVDAAIVACRRALNIDPGHPILMSHLGAFLFDAAQYQEAETVLRRAVEIEPEYTPAVGNLANVLTAQRKYSEAKQLFLRALEIEPDFLDARWNYAMTLLDCGDWTEAWRWYDARTLKGDKRAYPTLPWPKWQGEDLSGKTIWVQGEQGVGDRILLSRYFHWLKTTYPTCRILSSMSATDLPDMTNLFWCFRDIVEFIPNGVPSPAGIDYHVFLASLPGFHGTTIDNVYPDPGLIRAQAEQQRHMCNLPPPLLPSLKVGVIWAGGQAMKRNIERSVPFEVMMRLAELPNVVLYSLQFDNNDLWNFGADLFISDLSRAARPLGYIGTATAMLQLDLVITACTSAAHLAGALGVPTWTLLCAHPYWVWQHERSDCVWYPNMRLFRQSSMYDWGSVFDQIQPELARFADERCVKNVQQQAA
jgi:hypothetical protein